MNQNKIERLFFKIGQHSILIALAVIFAFPFLWMLGTSAKIDREMFSDDRSLMPRAPQPVVLSPYIAKEAFAPPKRPPSIPAVHYTRVTNALSKRVSSAVSAVVNSMPVHTHAAAHQEIREGMWARVNALTSYNTWTNSALASENIAPWLNNPQNIDAVSDQCYRRFSIRLSRVRDMNLMVHNLAENIPPAEQWKSLSPNARVVPVRQGEMQFADVHYSFASTDVVCIQAEFDLPFPASNLFQYSLSYRPDSTWHRMYVKVEGGGQVMESQSPVYLFDTIWSGVMWQRPSEQDEEIKIKRWVQMPVTEQGEEYNLGTNTVRVTIILKQSSKMQAWWGKITRNYISTFKYIPFARYFGTSAFLVILNIIGTLFASTLVAYAFSRLRWPGRDLCFMVLLATLMIPPQVTMIPGFVIMKWFGWYNTLQPLWVFSFCGNAFFIFLLRQFMKGIPNDLEDAARIDGCGFLRIYWYVILPLVKPTMAAIAIFTFMGVWNDFMGPLIFLNDHRLYPLSLGLFSLNVQAGGNFGLMMASSFLMTLPVIVIFFFAQKYFIQGVTLTGMKG